MHRLPVIGLLWLSSLVAADIPTGPINHLFDLQGPAGDPMSLPTDVEVGDDGRVYVVDSGNNRIVIFSRRGKRIKSFSGPGSGDGLLKDPVGLGIGKSGDVYIADKGNFRISVFSPDGDFRKIISLTVDGLQIAPVDVAATPDGRSLVITGGNNHKVMAFDIDGRLLRAWGGPGVNKSEFRYPATVAIDSDATILVVDVLNARIQKFTPQGELLVQYGQWGVEPGQLFRPKGVALDQAQRVYVSDSYLGVIQVFDGESRFLYVLGQDGTPALWSAPVGITIDTAGRLYVAEMLANRVSVYSLEAVR